MADRDDQENNLVAAGALLAILMAQMAQYDSILTSVDIMLDPDNYPTNQIDISLSFMGSPYRLTVERVIEGD